MSRRPAILTALVLVVGLGTWRLWPESNVQPQGASEVPDQPAPQAPDLKQGDSAKGEGAAPDRSPAPNPIQPSQAEKRIPPAARRVATVPKTGPEQQSLIEGYLKPQAFNIGKSLGSRYEEIIKSLTPEQAAMLNEETKPVIWRLAQAKIGWEVAINQQLQDYVSEGRDIPSTQDPKSGKHYIAMGSFFWGAKPGQVWGPNGAVVDIPFALTQEDHPRLAASWEAYRAAGMDFSNTFTKKHH